MVVQFEFLVRSLLKRKLSAFKRCSRMQHLEHTPSKPHLKSGSALKQSRKVPYLKHTKRKADGKSGGASNMMYPLLHHASKQRSRGQHLKDTPPDWSAELVSAMGKKYDRVRKVLNLEQFILVWISTKQSDYATVVKLVVNTIVHLFSDVQSIILRSNGLDTLNHMKGLVGCTKDLTHLDVSYNELLNLSALGFLKGLPLEKIDFAGNPGATQFGDNLLCYREHFMNKNWKLFPKLREFDGTAVTEAEAVNCFTKRTGFNADQIRGGYLEKCNWDLEKSFETYKKEVVDHLIEQTGWNGDEIRDFFEKSDWHFYKSYETYKEKAMDRLIKETGKNADQIRGYLEKCKWHYYKSYETYKEEAVDHLIKQTGMNADQIRGYLEKCKWHFYKSLETYQEEAVRRLSEISKLNLQYSRLCLAEYNWHADAAYEAFKKCQQNLPTEAFIH